ncbi:hypothetical protein [Croceicoccus marinus]|jgi:hypothetical protein|uniref:Argininosuccinate lyase n=1 Tax=Croceicoccus marinus TaxID=450378 RepID=A0A7G6VX06_9SPHN|nr:hypothetical protein [Croceicoccus marinus]QNE06271.1 hypothetical protein H4O24_06605 [Croceicoccus marinus]
MRLAITLALAALAVTGCARQTELKPAPGNDLPPKPYGAATRPDADDLLDRPVQAAPERNVELRVRSEPREEDPFDLPPEG